MKQIGKAIGVTLVALVPVTLMAAYLLSCINAGQRLSWDQFSEGLLKRTSNCGGNSAAASYCSNIALTAKVAGADSNDVFDLKNLSREYQNELSSMNTRVWTPDAKYLLNAGPIHTGTNTHDLVVVCDTPYDNVPQPTIWNLHRRSLRHAAGYSDGSVGWLTPAQFAALNKSNFIELKYTPKAVGNETNSFFFE